LVIPQPSRSAEKLLDKSLMCLSVLCLIIDALRLQPHRLLDGGKLLVRDNRCPFADHVGQGLLWYEDVHKAATQCFRRAFKTFHGDVSGGFAALKLDNSGLVYP
jgi:hypothetical protein